MDEISVSVDLRGFKTLLNAVRAKLYPYSGEDVSDEDILSVLQQSQSELSAEELQNEISLFESVSIFYSYFNLFLLVFLFLSYCLLFHFYLVKRL